MRRLLTALLLAWAAVWARAGDDFFPIGIYSVPDTNDFHTVRDAGFNLVVGPARESYLNAADQAGLKVLSKPGTAAGKEFDAGKLKQTVDRWDSHPALWAWYLVDEPDLKVIPPAQVATAHQAVKETGSKKPTALVLYQGYEARNYAAIPDILMVDRYPIPWLPLANFSQHLRMARLGLEKEKPLIAVIQAFDWSAYPKHMQREEGMRPPTYEELRCMTYLALVREAEGLFYYAFDSNWKMREQPATWNALKRTLREVCRRLPLFQADHRWWGKRVDFHPWERRFNAALEASVESVWLHVEDGTDEFPAGDYVLAVNTTPQRIEYSFTLPKEVEQKQNYLTVYDEGRFLGIDEGWVTDRFGPFAVHLYRLAGGDP